MANTLHTLPDVIADGAVPILEKLLAPLNVFTTNFTTEGRRTIAVPRHTVVGAVQTNPSSYTNTADTTVEVDIAVSEYSAQFGITSQEQLLGHSLQTRAKRHAHLLAQKIWDAVLAKVAASTFTNTLVTVAEASITATHLRTLRASIKDAPQKFLVLNGTAFTQLMMPATHDLFVAGSALYGFDGIYEANKWDASGLETNAYGFACGPEALLIAAGIPNYTDRVRQNVILDETIVEVPGVGISVAFRHQVSNDGRSEHATMDVLFGAMDGDESALTIITSA